MNVGDTLRVLALAAQYDPAMLPVDEQEQATKAAAWNHALDTRIKVEWALTTVAAIYAEQPGVRLLPANLNTRFLAGLRRGHEPPSRPRLPRPPDEPVPDTPALPPAGRGVGPSEEQRQQMRGAITRPEWWGDRQRSLAVACPHCGAEAGQVCTVQGRELRAGPAHPTRLAAV